MCHPVIDVHAHLWAADIESATEALPGRAEQRRLEHRRLGDVSADVGASQLRSRLPLLVDVDQRLAAMTAAGIDAQVVSITPTQYHHWIRDPAAARELAHLTHEVIAAHCAARPEQLVGLGVIPQQFPALAADALDDAFAHGLRGVEISTHAPDPDRGAPIELSDRRYDDFWVRAVHLGAVIFLHPWGCTLDDRLSQWYLSNSVGQLVEHTVALSHLIVGGVLERFGQLRVIVGHGGGYLPGTMTRADHAWRERLDARTTPRPPSSYLPQLFFDSLVHEPAALRRLVDEVGYDHVLLGSDYPFDMGDPDPCGRLRAAGLEPRAISAVAGGNAARIGLAPGPRPVTLSSTDQKEAT
ncbi:amidohydrolase [Amycolatopsis sp. NBC_00345]|uniref:amidohydrolase family protein n=1 Tax=Amycolatopsis sp. NBC_00345 TaxID=2975955 RepID=UPI002E25A9D7